MFLQILIYGVMFNLETSLVFCDTSEVQIITDADVYGWRSYDYKKIPGDSDMQDIEDQVDEIQKLFDFKNSDFKIPDIPDIKIPDIQEIKIPDIQEMDVTIPDFTPRRNDEVDLEVLGIALALRVGLYIVVVLSVIGVSICIKYYCPNCCKKKTQRFIIMKDKCLSKSGDQSLLIDYAKSEDDQIKIV